MIGDDFIKALERFLLLCVALGVASLMYLVFSLLFTSEAEEFYEGYQQKLEECQRDLPRNQECKLIVVKPD